MKEGKPRFEADRRVHEELAARFFDALRDGDVDGLRELLAADVVLAADAGGKVPTLPRPVVGAEKAIRVLLVTMPRLTAEGVSVESCTINGGPGAICRDAEGAVLNAIALEFLGGQIQTVRAVSNPDKLRHLGPVGDGWKVAARVSRRRGAAGGA